MSVGAVAQDKPSARAKPDAAAVAPEAKPVEAVVGQKRTTRLSGQFGGQKINYSATIGETIIRDKDGADKAAIVTTSYVKEPRDPRGR